MRYLDNLEMMLQNATKSIKEKLEVDKPIVFLEEDDIYEDKFYEQPVFSKVIKHGFYEEYSIISIRKDEIGNVYVKGIERGETREEEEVDINEVESSVLCYLADKLNGTV